jgi:uncharacterized membrane protein YoaK (UPF0700 family)
MLLGLTLVTGLVDAVSVLELGRVFVANMTGNVVFVGFALAGAPGFSLAASLFALTGFLVGAAAGGVVFIDRLGADRAVLLRAGALIELLLLGGAFVVSALGTPFDTAQRDGMAALLAVAMGLQNAIARELAVPDLTTTVLTMTLTGIVADLRSVNRSVALRRRFLAVGTMFAGAVSGAELALHGRAVVAVGLATGVLLIVASGAVLAARVPGEWHTK